MESQRHAVNQNQHKIVDTLWQRILFHLVPPRCVLCQAPGVTQLDLCQRCRANLPWLEISCPRCAQPLATPGLCGACLKQPPAFTDSLVPLRYEAPVSGWISAFKFHAQFSYGRVLARILADSISTAAQPLPQLILPVPLHPQRLRQRGYNQAGMIARDLGQWLNIPVGQQLQRRRATVSQTGLNQEQRRRNLRHAFVVEHPLPDHIAIVDDVVTTTSTVRACAQVLHQAGVKRIEIWALARTA